MKIVKLVFNLPKKLLVLLINFYQKFFSPDHSFWAKKFYPHGYCKFYPTCSEYCKQSIENRGVIKGSFSCVWRVLRCNPWSSGGIDKPSKDE